LRVRFRAIQGRNDCFEFLKPFIELIESRTNQTTDHQPRLELLIESYFKIPATTTEVKGTSMMFSKKFNGA